MSIVVEVSRCDPSLRDELRSDAQRVVGQFQNLPALRLLAFFDGEDAAFFRKKFGETNRGQFVDLLKARISEWPSYLKNLIDVPDPDHPPQVNRHFDNVIYVYATTCADPVGRIMTFAHELQHFVQYRFDRNLWAQTSY
jgi:hypothetical protein